MSMTTRVCGWVLGGMLGLGGAQAATACAFHGYTPDPTLVDILLTTEQVVIVRLDPSNPNRYTPVDALIGPDALDVPIVPGAATRARLSGRPSATVLLARDGAYGPWLELAVLDDRYRAIVDHVLQRQSAWLFGGEKERLSLFAERLNDPNPDIRRLALQELDRAPYGTLQDLRLPSVRNLRQDLETGDDDLMPIRILLAGLSKDTSLSRFLSTELDAAIHNDVPYMGAYATALIELEGQAAVQAILDRHLSAGTLSLETREKLLEALALQHKTAPAPTRRVIASGVADLLRTSPDLNEAAARQFGFRNHWSVSKPVSRAKTARPASSNGGGSDADR